MARMRHGRGTEDDSLGQLMESKTLARDPKGFILHFYTAQKGSDVSARSNTHVLRRNPLRDVHGLSS
jgi:hypothetical protein